MEYETKGHSNAQGGLRGHSLGDTYPIIPVWRGGKYYAFNALSGEQDKVGYSTATECLEYVCASLESRQERQAQEQALKLSGSLREIPTAGQFHGRPRCEGELRQNLGLLDGYEVTELKLREHIDY